MSDKEVILSQARKLEKLEKQVSDLQDQAFKRSQWLMQAKSEAGYPPYVSFDEVWADALECLIREKGLKQ